MHVYDNHPGTYTQGKQYAGQWIDVRGRSGGGGGRRGASSMGASGEASSRVAARRDSTRFPPAVTPGVRGTGVAAGSVVGSRMQGRPPERASSGGEARRSQGARGRPIRSQDGHCAARAHRDEAAVGEGGEPMDLVRHVQHCDAVGLQCHEPAA